MIVVYFVNRMKLICPAGNTHIYCGYIQRTPVTVVTLVTYFRHAFKRFWEPAMTLCFALDIPEWHFLKKRMMPIRLAFLFSSRQRPVINYHRPGCSSSCHRTQRSLCPEGLSAYAWSQKTIVVFGMSQVQSSARRWATLTGFSYFFSVLPGNAGLVPLKSGHDRFHFITLSFDAI